MFEVVTLNSAGKRLRNLDKPVKNRVIEALEQIVENPFRGERLKGDLTAIYSYHLKVAWVEYWIIYQINLPFLTISLPLVSHLLKTPFQNIGNYMSVLKKGFIT